MGIFAESRAAFLPYRLIRLAAYAEYYQLTKEYDKALVYLEDAIELVTPISLDDAMIYGLQKADILVKMGFPDDALPVYKQITKAKDSLYTVFSTSQIEQIQSLYNMDQLLFQKEQRQATFHRICLVTSIIIIIALLLFNLHMYRSRKRLQQDEKEMSKLAIIAEEANEIKSRFLANMSYNIRIPLNNVVGFSQLLSTDNELDEEERKEYSGIIQTNSGELIQLVNDVLDLSRLEANMMKFQLQDCNVKEWCNELGCLIQMRSEGRILLELQVEVGDVRQPPYTNSDKYAALSERLQRNAQSQHVLGQPSGQTHHRMPDREQSYSRFQVCLSKSISATENQPVVL